MDALDTLPNDKPADCTIRASKAIGDLDDLIQAIVKATPDSKPWQRQVLLHLRDVERQIQVLRMTISLKRGDAEVADAVESIRKTLRAANSYVAVGRADMGTKAAVRFALELSQKAELRNELGSRVG